MKKKLVNNLGLKIMSVALGFAAWVGVTNISNPEVTRTKTVPLTVVNEDVLTNAGKTYDIETGDSVVVSYTVRYDSANRISADDFRCSIDLANLYEVTGSVPVTVEVLNHKDLISGTPTAKPSVIRVHTEDVQNKSFDLTTKTVGEPAPDCAVGSLTLSPDNVLVSGPVSVVGRISSVGVEVNVTGASDDLSGSTGITYYDANGNKIEITDERLTSKPDTVDFVVDMLHGKTLTLSFSTSGEPAPGYRFTGVECSVKSVAVVGEQSEISSLSELAIPAEALSVENATENRDVVLDLNQYLPEGVTVNGDSTVTVTLKVEALNTRAYQVSLDSGITAIGQQDTYVYNLDPDILSVELSGLPEDLDKVSASDLSARIDFTGMGPGVHEGQLIINTPDGTTVASVTPFTIQVTEESGGPGETVPGSSAEASSGAEESSGESVPGESGTGASGSGREGSSAAASESGVSDSGEALPTGPAGTNETGGETGTAEGSSPETVAEPSGEAAVNAETEGGSDDRPAETG